MCQLNRNKSELISSDAHIYFTSCKINFARSIGSSFKKNGEKGHNKKNTCQNVLKLSHTTAKEKLSKQ